MVWSVNLKAQMEGRTKRLCPLVDAMAQAHQGAVEKLGPVQGVPHLQAPGGGLVSGGKLHPAEGACLLPVRPAGLGLEHPAGHPVPRPAHPVIGLAGGAGLPPGLRHAPGQVRGQVLPLGTARQREAPQGQVGRQFPAQDHQPSRRVLGGLGPEGAPIEQRLGQGQGEVPHPLPHLGDHRLRGQGLGGVLEGREVLRQPICPVSLGPGGADGVDHRLAQPADGGGVPFHLAGAPQGGHHGLQGQPEGLPLHQGRLGQGNRLPCRLAAVGPGAAGHRCGAPRLEGEDAVLGKGGTPRPLAAAEKDQEQGGAEGKNPFETLFHSIYTSFPLFQHKWPRFATGSAQGGSFLEGIDGSALPVFLLRRIHGNLTESWWKGLLPVSYTVFILLARKPAGKSQRKGELP